jgi:hypothetical protein
MSSLTRTCIEAAVIAFTTGVILALVAYAGGVNP